MTVPPSAEQAAIDALPRAVRDAFLWECGSLEIDPRGTQAAVLMQRMVRDALIERAPDGAD